MPGTLGDLVYLILCKEALAWKGASSFFLHLNRSQLFLERLVFVFWGWQWMVRGRTAWYSIMVFGSHTFVEQNCSLMVRHKLEGNDRGDSGFACIRAQMEWSQNKYRIVKGLKNSGCWGTMSWACDANLRCLQLGAQNPTVMKRAIEKNCSSYSPSWRKAASTKVICFCQCIVWVFLFIFLHSF